MLLYLVASPLLFVLALCLFYRVTSARHCALPFLRGMLVALPLLLVWLVLRLVFDLSYDPRGLYLHHLSTGMLYPLLPGIALFYLFERSLLRERGYIVVLGSAAFLAGIYLVHAVVDVLRIPHHYGPYVAFLLPTLRLGLIAVVPPLLGAASREPRPLRFLFVLLVAVIPAAFAGVPLLFELRYVLVSHLLTALALGVSLLIHVALMGAYFPRRPRAFDWSLLRSRARRRKGGGAGDAAAGEQDAVGDTTPVTQAFERSAPDA
jgi:hypothetical protein